MSGSPFRVPQLPRVVNQDSSSAQNRLRISKVLKAKLCSSVSRQTSNGEDDSVLTRRRHGRVQFQVPTLVLWCRKRVGRQTEINISEKAVLEGGDVSNCGIAVSCSFRPPGSEPRNQRSCRSDSMRKKLVVPHLTLWMSVYHTFSHKLLWLR